MYATLGPQAARTFLAADTFDRDSPTQAVLGHVTNRWASLILAALTEGPYRYSALHHRIGGISQQMLSRNLKSLVGYGLVDRSKQANFPPHVTYTLTARGAELAEPLCALIHRVGAHAHELLQDQAESPTASKRHAPTSMTAEEGDPADSRRPDHGMDDYPRNSGRAQQPSL